MQAPATVRAVSPKGRSRPAASATQRPPDIAPAGVSFQLGGLQYLSASSAKNYRIFAFI
jgi:hypothetical protein